MLIYLHFYKNQILFYLFITLIIYIICTFIYIKLRYRFWSCQYIYTNYSYFNKFYKNKIINDELFKKNKFTNTFDITFIKNNNIDKNTYTNIVNLLIDNYLTTDNFITKNDKDFYNNNNIEYKINDNVLKKCIFNDKTNISIFFKSDYNFNKNLNVFDKNNMLGIIQSNKLYLNFYKEKIKEEIHNIEYLCISNSNYKNKNKNIDYQLFQTHLYYLNNDVKNKSKNKLNNRKNIKKIYIFKIKNINNKFLVPLIKYNNYLYDINIFKKSKKAQNTSKNLNLRKSIHNNIRENKNDILNNIFKVILINQQNFNIFVNLFEECKFNFDISILNNLQTILNKVIYKNIFIFALLQYDTPLCIYIFQNNYICFNDRNTIHCISSINNCINNNVFINGFYDCLNILVQKYNFTYLYIDNLSYNYLLISNISNKIKVIETNTYYYILYNYIYDTYQSNKVFNC